MGRRSINTTKSGKYMNPTDQARKEARKRELKKNKKQRQMVRAAVLKGKDPMQIITDMEKIDEMEYNVDAPPMLNEKVLKDKRKKLKETWDRVMRLYSKEDRSRYLELKKLEIEYETKRSSLMKYFESVRVAQQVQIDEIPLPSAPDMPTFLTSQIPLPSEPDAPLDVLQAPTSILKKVTPFLTREVFKNMIKPPGVPPGPPPDLSSDDEEDLDTQKEATVELSTGVKTGEGKAKSKKIRFADERAEGMDSDDDLDTNNKEAKQTNTGDAQASDVLTGLKPEDIPVPPLHQVPLPSGPPPGLPQGPPPMMFRPPPLRAGIPPPPRLLPPGVPPPGRSFPLPGLPLRLGAPPIRLPPGPPPGIPPMRLNRPPGALSQRSANQSEEPLAVFSAPPSLMQRPKHAAALDEPKRTATIEAKPQIRNLSADIMRFTPTTLRVKREDRSKKGQAGKGGFAYESSKDAYATTAPTATSASAPTKDDAYMQFLREMEQLL